jgi:hypothetical protein
MGQQQKCFLHRPQLRKKYLLNRLRRKRDLLNIAIGIKTKAQRSNLRWKLKKGIYTVRNTANPRAVDEWVRNGLAIERLNKELRSRKNTVPTDNSMSF